MSWFADLEDLVASAVTATGHGEDLAAAHLADLANRQQVIRDAQRALRDAGASQGRAAA